MCVWVCSVMGCLLACLEMIAATTVCACVVYWGNPVAVNSRILKSILSDAGSRNLEVFSLRLSTAKNFWFLSLFF